MSETKLREAVAAEVRAATARANLTQAELSAKSGISTSALTRKWHGRTSFTIEELIAVASATGQPAAALLPKDNAVAA